MAELILCRQMLAALPYYISEASLNVYSLEELSYYIEHNVYLLDSDFMSEELCDWVDKELHLKKMAEKMREICRKSGTLTEFVTEILQESGYCSSEEIAKLETILEELENKSEFECGKMRADRYVENRRYISGIQEYRRLLLNSGEQSEELLGNVWHNMGRAYAGLFLFQEAAACFQKAYAQNQNQESLREYLYACKCMKEDRRYAEAVTDAIEKYNLSEEEIDVLAKKLTEMSRGEDICRFEEELDEAFLMETSKSVIQYIEEWKNIYRKNCRI